MTPLYLYRLSQKANDNWDTYSDFIVCAADEEEALNTHPDGRRMDWQKVSTADWTDWVWCRQQVAVELIGVADPAVQRGAVLCASYHAG